VDGLLILDKPAGWTSHDVVARVRRLTGERRAGHAGTLDPLATGVLPVGLGQGTRVLEYVSSAGKTYRALLRLGVSTDSYDAEGAVTRTAPVGDFDEAAIEAALLPFRGTFSQRAPMFSALKLHGRPLYRYARAGLAIEPPVRTVRVDALRVCDWKAPDLELEIECASGFYVRSLAHDLGEALGCGAHLRALRRTRVGGFDQSDAVGLEELAGAIARGPVGDCLWSLDAPLRAWPAVILAGAHAGEVSNGRPLGLPARASPPSTGLCRAYSVEGELLGILELFPDGQARPIKIFPPGRRGLNEEEEYTPIAVIP